MMKYCPDCGVLFMDDVFNCPRSSCIGQGLQKVNEK